MSAPPLPGIFASLAPVLDHWGYLAVAGFLVLEDFGVPVPGETILIAASVYAGAGRLNVVAVGIIGFLAAVAGDNIGFAIGHFGGRALALRWGRYVFLTPERLDKTEAFFERHGGKIIVVARFIEGLRQANGIVAGITGMHWRRFLAFNALGAALWVGVWITIGYVSGNHITTIYNYITRYSLYVLIVLAALLVAYIAWHILRHRRRKPAVASEANGSGETQELIGAAAAEAVTAAPEANEATGTAPDGHAPPDGAPGDGDHAASGDHAAPGAPPASERHSSETA